MPNADPMTLGVLLSLIFVGIQIKQNTAALHRNEHNISMEEWTTSTR